MVALYTVGVRGDRRRSLVVGAVTAFVLVVAIALLEATGNVQEGTMRLLFVLGALVVGDTVRSRRALRQAAVERAAQRDREHEQDALRRMDEERLRIARELHDTIAHALVAINVRAGVAERVRDDRADAKAMGEIKQVSAEALRDLRATLDVLREQGAAAPTRPVQDLTAVPELVERARATGLDARVELALSGTQIASPVGHAAFRIVQESLTNVLRHADAKSARVRVRVATDTLEVEVVDDGRGGTLNGGGHGLRGMAERSRALGGSVVAGPAPGGGWRVHARLPLPVRR
jgi:signal transduction histidine kinase